MGDDATASPLAMAALSLVAGGATAADLVERFADLDARVPEETAARLLDELAALGLVRVARGRQRGRVFVTTSLARRTELSSDGGADQGELLRELERMRTDLLSTVAHELRTPLTAVRTSVGLLRDDEAAPTAAQRRTLLETIERNADRMQRLVDDTLDLARFREGRIQLQLRRFDAADLARAVAASFPERAGRIELVAPTRPVWVFGDRRRLEHALVNLYSNARKYSPPETTITISVDAAPPLVRWTVVDRGPGISDADQGRLFERFFVGRSDRSGRHEGVGLGLPIALAIVEAHGGAIEVDSAPGQGSRFTIAVPADGPDEDWD